MFKPFDLVRIKATGVLVTIETDHGPEARPRYSINESDQMYDGDELELVFPAEDQEKYDDPRQKRGAYMWRE